MGRGSTTRIKPRSVSLRTAQEDRAPQMELDCELVLPIRLTRVHRCRFQS